MNKLQFIYVHIAVHLYNVATQFRHTMFSGNGCYVNVDQIAASLCCKYVERGPKQKTWHRGL
jgi:hypothetical protein